MNQFDPEIIKKITGLSTYNCGFGGQGLQFSYIQLNETLKRYKPELIVLDVSPNILLDPESREKLKILLPYFKRDTLIFNALTNNMDVEKVKLLSAIYPYNSTIGSLIRGLNMDYSDSLNGFEPINRALDTFGLYNKVNEQFPDPKIPADKFIYLHQIIKLCIKNELQLVVVVCPIYQKNKNLDEMITQIKAVCTAYNDILFLDYSKNLVFTDQINLFYDNLHLNKDGAQLFSDSISRKLPKNLEIN